ncbi:hypothetical protein ABZ614_32640, partial [Streptomyces sp. NPDC013178]
MGVVVADALVSGTLVGVNADYGDTAVVPGGDLGRRRQGHHRVRALPGQQQRRRPCHRANAPAPPSPCSRAGAGRPQRGGGRPPQQRQSGSGQRGAGGGR